MGEENKGEEIQEGTVPPKLARQPETKGTVPPRIIDPEIIRGTVPPALPRRSESTRTPGSETSKQPTEPPKPIAPAEASKPEPKKD